MSEESVEAGTDGAAAGQEVVDVVSDAISSWPKTFRLCVILLAATPAVVVVVVVLVLVRG
jgi:hypothetical protein